jgi:hypothetical protein
VSRGIAYHGCTPSLWQIDDQSDTPPVSASGMRRSIVRTATFTPCPPMDTPMQSDQTERAIDPVLLVRKMNRLLLASVFALLLCLTAEARAADFRSPALHGGYRPALFEVGPGADADSSRSDPDSVLHDAGIPSRSDLEKFGFDFGHALSSPTRWDSDDLLVVGGVVAGTITAVLLDDECRELMQRNRSPFNDVLHEVGYTWGGPQFAAPGAILIYLTGLVVDDDWTHETGRMLVSTLSIAAVIQIPVRMTAGRARPNANLGSASFDLFGGTLQPRASFISGHAFIAFGMSTVLARRIDHPVATVALYSLAMTTSFVRLNRDAHWLSDVFFGSVLGFVLGNVVVDGQLDGEHLGMIVSPSQIGLTYRW